MENGSQKMYAKFQLCNTQSSSENFKKFYTQQTFQRCFNVVFWLTRRCDVGQCQINIETTLCISTMKFTTFNNVESTLCISTLT